VKYIQYIDYIWALWYDHWAYAGGRVALYLAFKEIWRNKGRFFLVSLVIALITSLVLFIAALSEGLALANKQLFDKLNADLIVFQENVDLSASTSRIDFTKLNDIARVDGIKSVGPIGLSNATIISDGEIENTDIALVGVEAGKPGDPAVIRGNPLRTDRGSEAVIDALIAERYQLNPGDRIRIKTIQGSKEEYFDIIVVGITDERQYFFQPSVFLPYRTWEQVRPQSPNTSSLVSQTSNIVGVQIKPGYDPKVVASNLNRLVKNIEVTDKQTAIESLPGYTVQQNTLNTQRSFTLLIGILVIGGFFQIQMLQKIPLIGVMKAIGVSNASVAVTVVAQIVMVTTFGVILGGLVTFGLAQGIPATVPVIFDGTSVAIAVLTLLSIGPIGGLVSVRAAVKVEPLIALGLSQ
jgi:putative ABC transport system permease protein